MKILVYLSLLIEIFKTFRTFKEWYYNFLCLNDHFRVHRQNSFYSAVLTAYTGDCKKIFILLVNSTSFEGKENFQ